MTIKIDKNDIGTFNEFVGQIIDIFEDFLEDHNVTLDNPEKEQDPDAAIIYGSDYGDLYQEIEELLVNWSEAAEAESKCKNVEIYCSKCGWHGNSKTVDRLRTDAKDEMGYFIDYYQCPECGSVDGLLPIEFKEG